MVNAMYKTISCSTSVLIGIIHLEAWIHKNSCKTYIQIFWYIAHAKVLNSMRDKLEIKATRYIYSLIIVEIPKYICSCN